MRPYHKTEITQISSMLRIYFPSVLAAADWPSDLPQIDTCFIHDAPPGLSDGLPLQATLTRCSHSGSKALPAASSWMGPQRKQHLQIVWEAHELDRLVVHLPFNQAMLHAHPSMPLDGHCTDEVPGLLRSPEAKHGLYQAL